MAAVFAPFNQLVRGFQASQVLYVVVKFGFADILKDGPKSGEEVAKLAKTHEENTNRVLRAAAGLGIFDRDPATLKYSLNDLSNALVDGPTSLRYAVFLLLEDSSALSWRQLDKAVESGVHAFKEVHGETYFEYLKTHPVSSDRFGRAMTGFSALVSLAQPLTALYGFQEAKHLIDIGGGHGILAAEILRANPHLKGTSFDLPHVVEEAKAKQVVTIADVGSRFEYASGSFFESVPSGGDIYTLKSIIHDWEDAKAIEILKTVRNALPDHGKVVLLEIILQETGDARGALMDLQMLVMLNSKERTEEEFRKLFDAAGLKLTRVIPLSPSFFNAIEAVKK